MLLIRVPDLKVEVSLKRMIDELVMLFVCMLPTTSDQPRRKMRPGSFKLTFLRFTSNMMVFLWFIFCSILLAHTDTGHSMTIIGFEIRDNGSANLLVFDPMFKTSPAMERLVGSHTKPSDPTRLLKAYRRGTPYLQKYKIFELLERTPHSIKPDT
ncbi:unnamed protein product [Penicillium salamii]|nr:unnamed protein product [Penicillium salamii]CAG8144558.1 unnamed protein product [Penicillium salamii]CAG8357231.1 unnamed protein product [Penicillium salamii]